MKRINGIIFVILLMIVGGIVSADLQIYRNIKNTVGYMSKMLFTTDGTTISSVKVSIDGTTGNVSLSGDLRIGNRICLGGVCKSALDSLWSLNGSNVYYNGGRVSIGTNVSQAGVALNVSGIIFAENNIQTRGNLGGFVFWDRSNNGQLWQWYSQAGLAYLWYNNGTTQTIPLSINTLGNVGIGTSLPGYKLDINDGGTTAMIRIHQSDSVKRYEGLRLDRTGNVEKWFIGMDDTTDNFLLRRAGTTNDIVIGTTGNMGIGMTPTSKFSIKSSGDGHGILLQANGNTNTVARLVQNNTDDGRLYLYSAGTIKSDINSNGSSYLNGGNVGIGTTSPGYKLDIYGNMAGASAYFYNHVTRGGDNNTTLAMDRGGLTNYEYLTFRTGNVDKWYFGLTNDNTDNFFITSSGSIRNLSIYNSNVGIGAVPSYKLHVVGDTYITGGRLKVAGTKGLYFNDYTAGIYMQDASWIRTTGNQSLWTNNGLLGTNGGLSVGYNGVIGGTANGGASIAGNVGIGISAPAYKLDVVGSINTSSSLCINGDCKTAWSQVGGGGTVNYTGTCDTSHKGYTGIISGIYKICNGVRWVTISGVSMDGTSSLNAGTSCLQIKTDYPSSTNGYYRIISGLSTNYVYCDMTNGGRTLVVRIVGDQQHSNTASVGTLTTYNQGTSWKLSDTIINGIPKTVGYKLDCAGGVYTFSSSCVFTAGVATNSYCNVGGFSDPRGLNTYPNVSPNLMYGHRSQSGCYNQGSWTQAGRVWVK